MMAIFISIATVVSGFLLFNWPPATIFMGDSGSVFRIYFWFDVITYNTQW